jgi:hypothetical protein
MRKLILALAFISSPALATDYEISASSVAALQLALFQAGFTVGSNAVNANTEVTTTDGKGDTASLHCYWNKYLPTAFTPSTYGPYITSTGTLTLAFATVPGATVGTQVTLTGFTGGNASLNGTWPVASSLNGGKSLGITTKSGLGTLTLTGSTATMTYNVLQAGAFCIFRYIGPNDPPTLSGVTLIPLPANSPATFF